LGKRTLDDAANDIQQLFNSLLSLKNNYVDKFKMFLLLKNISSWRPNVYKGRGECQQVIINEPDLNIFPILKCWPEDGGPFITLPMVHTKDPFTRVRNVACTACRFFLIN
jgi:4-hydroxy-3-polyprenylbenzoate decarboxylase